MANGVLHVELGIELNLTRPDLGHPHLSDLWEQLRAARPIRPGVLECLDVHDCPRWMKLVERADGTRHAAHYTLAQLRELAAKSDEHAARQEYIAARAEREGLGAAVEQRRASGNRVVDVRVNGPVPIACEIQTSYIHEGTVARRAKLDRQAGDTPLWIPNDRYSAAINRAPWARVDKSSAPRIASGLDDIIRGGVMAAAWERCGFDDPMRCPNGGLPCGNKHIYLEQKPGIHLDELVIGAATGGYRPTTRRVGHSTHRIWLTAADHERYGNDQAAEPDARSAVAVIPRPREIDRKCRYGEDTGIRAALAVPRDTGASIAAVRPEEDDSLPLSQRLVAPTHIARKGFCGAGVTPCGAPARLYPAGWRCEPHRPHRLEWRAAS